MEKLTSMTEQEIVKKYGNSKAKLKTMLDEAPEYKKDPNPGGRPVARGFAEFKEYINRNGRPKKEDKKVHVSLRLPESVVMAFRTEPAYTTKLSEYIMDGINSGRLKVPRAEA